MDQKRESVDVQIQLFLAAVAMLSAIVSGAMGVIGIISVMLSLPPTPEEACLGRKDTIIYFDLDGDGFGGGDACCVAPDQHIPHAVTVGGDCDDNDPGRTLSTEEVCDNADNDCDGLVDEGYGTSLWYRDSDHDTYGDRNDTIRSCAQPAGYISNGTDCDDTHHEVHPTADELKNGLDDDCDGQIDENFIRP